MAIHDTIGNFLNSVKMASLAGQSSCTITYSRLAYNICSILKSEGFIVDFLKQTPLKGSSFIEIIIKYVSGVPSITGLERHSTPGCRRYYSASHLPRVLGGVGVGILTTSLGVMTDAQARRQKVGGELLAKIW